MQLNTFIAALGLLAPANALLRFGCAGLTVQRLDPLVNPGMKPSTHLHQIIGGDSFNISMPPETHDLVELSSCTSCQFKEDFSNYWTAVLYYHAKNGTYKRVPQKAQFGMEGTLGGMVVYYMSDALFDTAQRSSVTAFKPGFRMLVGDTTFRDREEARRWRQLTYICLDANQGNRAPESIGFPTTPCPGGIMANHRFPTCWDGENLDSPNHQDHVAYPESGTFESGGPCPSTHPVRLPQILLETVWDTTSFSDPADFVDGQQPFVWSNGDSTGFSNHADYLFGWEGDSLQRAMDGHTYVSAPMLTPQSIAQQNQCQVPDMVNEDIDSWLPSLPGQNPE